MLSDISAPPLEDLLRLVHDNYYKYFCRMKRQSAIVRVLERELAKARPKRKRADGSFQKTECVLNEHHYPGMLDWVETNTGIPSDEIHKAQLYTYQGRDELRHRLRDLGSSREMEKFWTDFKVEHPDVLFQQRLIGPESTEPKVAELVVRLESRLGHQPTGLQIAISISLDGQAFKTEELADLIAFGNLHELYYEDKKTKQGGLKELQNAGLVQHLSTVGYYRPDSRPPELIEVGLESRLGHQPTPLQIEIWKALDGRALTAQELANEVAGRDKSRLYYVNRKTQEGGLTELQNAGVVINLPTVGSYRRDSPPPDLPTADAE